MNLLIIRHAIAMEREDFAADGGKNDELRPLTQSGTKKMVKNAAGLRFVVPIIDLLVSSPLVRAEQTAAIVSDTYNDKPIVKCDALKPDTDPEKLLEFLRKLPQHSDKDAVIAVVGHEPHLSEFIAYACTGTARSFIEFKKGGACMLSFAHGVTAGKAQMQWIHKPATMRDLAKLLG